MPESLYALAFLACPLAMGLMMWMMMRAGNKAKPSEAESAESVAKQTELARLRAEIDLLRQDGRTADAVRQPSSSL